MPSTLVHLSLAALIAAGLFRDFDRRVLAVALLATLVPDLDTVLALVWADAHRAALHTILIPLFGAVLLAYDRWGGGSSRLLDRFGPRAHRLAGLAIVVYVVAGIGPDLMTNGANVLFPLQDQFYSFSGKIYYSTRWGFVQTLWEPVQSVMGSTRTMRYPTGVAPDPVPPPDPGEAPEPIERIFPIAHSGFQTLIIVIGVVVTGWRLRTESRR